MGTVVVAAVLVCVVGLILKGMHKDKKNGRSLQQLWRPLSQINERGTYEQRMCYSKIKRQWMPDNKTEADIA